MLMKIARAQVPVTAPRTATIITMMKMATPSTNVPTAQAVIAAIYVHVHHAKDVKRALARDIDVRCVPMLCTYICACTHVHLCTHAHDVKSHMVMITRTTCNSLRTMSKTRTMLSSCTRKRSHNGVASDAANSFGPYFACKYVALATKRVRTK